MGRLPDGGGSCWSAAMMTRSLRSARMTRSIRSARMRRTIRSARSVFDSPVRTRACAAIGRMGETKIRLIITASTSARGGRPIQYRPIGICPRCIKGDASRARNRAKYPLRTEHPCLAQTCYGPARRPIGARRQSARLVHKADWPGNRVLALQLHGGNGNKCRSRRPQSMRGCGDRSCLLDFGALPQATPKGIDTRG